MSRDRHMFNYVKLQSSIKFYHTDLCSLHSYTITFHLVSWRCACTSRISAEWGVERTRPSRWVRK